MKKKEEKKPKDVKTEDGEEEEEKSEGGVLSDSVLDAFDNDVAAPIDPLEDDPLLSTEDDDEDILDSGDYKISDEW